MINQKGSILLVKLLPIAFLLLAAAAAWYLLGQKTVLKNKAASTSVNVTAVAARSGRLPADVVIYLDPEGERLEFAKVVVNFTLSELKLASDPDIDSTFSDVVKVSSKEQANSSGRVEIVVGVGHNRPLPTSAVKLATLHFVANSPSIPVTGGENVGFAEPEMQFVAVPHKLLSPVSLGTRLIAGVEKEKVDYDFDLKLSAQGQTIIGNWKWPEPRTGFGSFTAAIRDSTTHALVSYQEKDLGRGLTSPIDVSSVVPGTYYYNLRAIFASKVLVQKPQKLFRINSDRTITIL